MTRFFDAMDGFFDRLFSGFRGVALTAVGIVAVIVLERATGSTTPMLLLALPGLYMMGRRGGAVSVVRFVSIMLAIAFVLWMSVGQVPCDGWGLGFRLFLGARC